MTLTSRDHPRVAKVLALMADEFCKDREPPPKRQRLDEVGTPVIKQSASSPESTGSSIPVGTSISPESEAAEGAPIKYGLPPLQEFTVDQVLFNSAKTKSVALTGQFTSRPTLRAVIVAEKQPLTESDLQTILSSSTSLSQSFQNDIYAQYIASCSGGVGALKVQTVYPAEDAHIRKYAAQPFHLVHESPGDYETITRPFIEREVLGLEVRASPGARKEREGVLILPHMHFPSPPVILMTYICLPAVGVQHPGREGGGRPGDPQRPRPLHRVHPPSRHEVGPDGDGKSVHVSHCTQERAGVHARPEYRALTSA